MEICTFSRGSFSFVAPEHYHVHNNFQPGYFAEKVGLYLCANKASLQRDPINWETLKNDLLQWAQQNTRYLPTLSTLTDQKFSQRIIPSHSPRSFNTDRNYVFKPSNNFFHYYDFSFPPGDETQSMKSHVPEPTHLELLSRINHHDRLAGTLGILPNHLIKLLKLTNPEDLTKIIDDLRFTTFWTTYSIWTKRQTLNREFWQNIPECCKLENKHKTLLDKKNPTGNKRRRRTKKQNLEDCKNPFHYLLLKKKMHPIRGTCSCSQRVGHSTDTDHEHRISTPILQEKIKKLENDFLQDDLRGLDFKHNPGIHKTQSDIRKFLLVKTSADISREEQDRKKCFKKS
jgi:hypothetical protein